MNELEIIVTQFQEQTKQLSNIITTRCVPRSPNEENIACRNVEQTNNKIKQSAEEIEKTMKEIPFEQTNESTRMKKQQKKHKKTQMPCKKKCMTKE